MTVVGEYVDRAKSATTDNRPEFQRMISESANHGSMLSWSGRWIDSQEADMIL